MNKKQLKEVLKMIYEDNKEDIANFVFWIIFAVMICADLYLRIVDLN